MDQRQLYLAWVRTNYPTIYMQALRKITGKTRSLGGLTDEMLDVAFSPDVATFSDTTQVSPDIYNAITVSAGPDPYAPAPLETIDTSTFAQPSQYELSAPSYALPNITTSFAAQPAPAAPSGGWFSSFANAVTQIGTTLIKSTAQNNLLQVNTARARAGQPPLNAMGVPISAASLGPANSQILALERSIAGSTGGMGGLFLFSIAALGVLLIFSGKGRR